MKVSIYTFTLGRDTYLLNLIKTIHSNLYGNWSDFTLEHHVCFQGVKPSQEFLALADIFKSIIPHYWEKNIGIAAGMNKILPKLSGDIIIKMDEDALPYCSHIRPYFFERVIELSNVTAGAVWSPYPVGLINNPGGPRGIKHETIRIVDPWDTIYTLRFVNHVGGFCRVSPGFTRDWKFSDDLLPGQSGNEDVQFSQKCLALSIPMFYVENGLAVEHQESTLGQHRRYGEDYFKGRF